MRHWRNISPRDETAPYIGFECYECRSSGGTEAQGMGCISETENTSECNKNYCTIYRREYVDPPGTIDEFHRSCEDTPTYLNAVIKTTHHVAYYRSCQQNLCNVGDGLVPFAKALLLDDDSDAKILIVPGIGSSGHRAASLLSATLLLSTIIIIDY
ncbi:uncharacterized protein [Venturia canescens]|uniref:uncharacterized protein isoform X2 n=1 Tax=Venturia canescens TaxID=32260 RepID=UPI001C9D554A|nr:uncharacterized protein LOC122406921 isoform X2 [Venturia canescens]